MARALADAPPITWQVVRDDTFLNMVQVTWTGLDGIVRRFLDLIPLDPPPDR